MVNLRKFCSRRQRKAIAAYLLIKKMQVKKTIFRSVGVSAIFKMRKKQGAYHNLVREMRYKDPKRFRNYHRMSVEDFDILEEKIRTYVSKAYHSTEPISPGEMLSATLRYLATGASMKSVSYSYRLGLSTVSNIICDTCSAIWEALKGECFESYTENYWKEIARGFQSKWNIPNCLGSIDGKHIRIQAPPNTGSDYFNYKDYFSIILLAMCDADYCFTAVDIGSQGRQSDGGVFRQSEFGKLFYSNSLNIPLPSPITEDGPPVPLFIVGDAAFPLGPNLMRPYPGRFLPQEQKIFNYRLSRARRVIENTFGILVSKWRIFERPIIAKLNTIDKIVQATVCLHNFLRKRDLGRAESAQYCPSTFIDRENENGDIILGEWRSQVGPSDLQSVKNMGGNSYGRGAANVRTILTNYFMYDAPIDIQWSK